jgi:hypothetical protein
MSSTENVKLGVCSVLFNLVDLGYTKGGVEVSVSTSTHEITVDQLGETAIGELITGRAVKATVPLVETTLENLVAIMPGAVLVTSGTGPATKKKVTVPTGVNTNLATIAKVLTLRPKGTTGAEDFTIHLAATAGALDFAFMLDKERVYNVEFKGYADATGLLFTVGDTTATA